jgi:hypothetical protein
MSELLKKSLSLLKTKVDEYIDTTNSGGTTDWVEIANIAALNDGDDFLESSFPIILSIVNIEEDVTARNPNLYRRTIDNALEKFSNPAQHLVVSLLFTAYTKDQTQEKYIEGINKLEGVIACFQKEHVFTFDDTTLILDLESLKISELNQLWSMLGNKYMPSVLYRMRMITIQNEAEEGEKEIEIFKIKLYEDANPENIAGQLEETGDITTN